MSQENAKIGGEFIMHQQKKEVEKLNLKKRNDRIQSLSKFGKFNVECG
jgi:hypothetical protein